MSEGKINVIAVGGPTASGKSALAVELAKKLNGEIISCDSMQIYRNMNIGTAKPTPDEMQGIPHHLIDICDPDTNFSAADWANSAKLEIEAINNRGNFPIICGGTGMYLDSLLRPTSFSRAVGNESIRKALYEYVSKHGKAKLHHMLEKVDPESAAEIHPNNVKRVVRALEIYKSEGITKTTLDRQSQNGDMKYNCSIVTIDYYDRERLYDRIDKRVDDMISAGLENEVRSLYTSGVLKLGTTASNAIGYKEMLLYISKKITFDEAVELIKRNTRRYAKRQITWFSRYPSISAVPDFGNKILSAYELYDSIAEDISACCRP